MQVLGTLCISEQESTAFAALSGDFNPLHVDPLAARRLLHGGTVLHGLHVCLLALDKAFQQMPSPVTLSEVRAQFDRPVRAGDRIEVWGGPIADDRARYVVRRRDETVQTIKVRLGPSAPSGAPSPNAPPDMSPARGTCKVFTLSGLEGVSGVVPLSLDRRALQDLFPTLLWALPPSQTAVLLATTNIVGMECPGLHSVFIGFKLTFGVEGDGDGSMLVYRVRNVDTRFSMVNIAVSSRAVAGELQTLVRPGAVSQAEYSAVKKVAAPDEFRWQRALVIGGSRGLGELAAKVIAAGGGEVRITYHAGRDDSQRIAAEINAGGGSCDILPFDVLAPEHASFTQALQGWIPTHVLFFATPRIELAEPAQWRPERFQRYCDYYVTGLERAVTAIAGMSQTARLTVFYPSTIFLDEPESGAQEYVPAKAAGEALCRYLEALHRPRLRCCSPRLPRLDTDQTSSVFATERRPDSLAVMLEAWKETSRPQPT